MSRRAAETFGEFYLASRRRLMVQTLALTGDLVAARSSVRDTFVVARHHWGKVSRLPDPEDWVRPRAWARAQHRAVGRIWHRGKELTERQRNVLIGLHRLPDAQRRALLLTQLAALPLDGIAHEIGQTRAGTEALLQQATTGLSLFLDCDSALLRAELECLWPLVDRVGLPRATVIERNGIRRRRRATMTWGAVVVIAVALVLGAGALLRSGPSAPTLLTSAPSHPVAAAMLLRPDQASPGHRWAVVRAGDNTGGNGSTTVCQDSRYADSRGVTAFAQTMHAAGSTPAKLVQTVEVATSPAAAVRAYRSSLAWYAGCRHAGVQLLGSHRVSGLGGRAQALSLRVPGNGRQTLRVVVARSGSVTDTVVLRTGGPGARRLRPVLDTAGASLRDLCAASATGACRVSERPQAHPALPPRSGDAPGMLATVDLPPAQRLRHAWVGTRPAPATHNPARTTCDRARFPTATRPLTRTFLIPQASLPSRFGVAETRARFAGSAEAGAFAQHIRKRMRTCEKRDPGSHVSHHVSRQHSRAGSSYDAWRLTNEVGGSDTVTYWMGVAVAGPYVAQVGFTPTHRIGTDQHAFAALVERARDRLLELPGSGRP